MKRILLYAAFSAVLFLGAACGGQPPAPAQGAEENGAKNAPAEVIVENRAEEAAENTSQTPDAHQEQGQSFANISTVDIYGATVDGGIFTEKELTMVNIWATYCGPCIMEMPYLGEMASEMPEGTGLVGLAADALNEEYIQLAVNIAEETGAAFTHLLPDEILFNYVYENVVGVPTTIFIDGEGNIVGEQLIGAQPRLVYEAELEKRLELVRNGDSAP